MFVEEKLQMQPIQVDQLVTKSTLEEESKFVHWMVGPIVFELPEFAGD